MTPARCQPAADPGQARVQQRGHRRRRLHHLGQPAMRGELRRSQDRRQRDEDRGARGGGVDLDGGQDRRDIRGAVGRGQQYNRQQKRHLACPRGYRLLARRARGGDPVGIEQQKPVQRDARQAPGQQQLEEVARHDQQQHRRQRCRHPAGEGALLSLAIHVGGGIAHHDPADETHQHQHDRADRIKAHRQPHARRTNQRRGSRPIGHHQHRRDRGDKEGGEGGGFGQFRQAARASARVAQAQPGDDQKDKRCQKGQHQVEHRDWPRSGFRSARHRAFMTPRKIHCSSAIVRCK